MKRTRTLKGSTSSAEIVGSVDDLVREILLKLPIKSLIHFKSVCKPWLSLISNPRFFPNPNPPRGIFLGDLSHFQYIPLYPNDIPISCQAPPVNLHFTTHGEILASCNGLMLCSKVSVYNPTKTIYVYNPTTNCSTTLPLDSNFTLPPNSNFTHRYPMGVSIAFDPVKSQHYKVVRVLELELHRLEQGRIIREQKSKYILRIYSSETPEWTTGGEVASPTSYTHFRFEEGVYCNGCIHWLGNLFYNPRISLRFHVDTLMLSEMPSPPRIQANHGDLYCFGEETRHYFGVSGDHLHFTECILPQFNISELARDYSEWFVKYKVDLSNLIARYPDVESFRKYVAYILSIVRGKNDDDSDSAVLVLRTPRKAIKFNLVNGSLEKLCDFKEDVPDDYVYLCEEDPARPMGFFIDGYTIDYVPCLTDV